MTELKVDTVVNLAGTGKPNFENGLTINGAATSTLNLNEYTESASEPSSPSNGALWWDTANSKTFIYAEGEWKETIGIAAGISWGGDRALVLSGRGSSWFNTVDYFDITSAGNASDFGDLHDNLAYLSCASDASRVVYGGGQHQTTGNKDAIYYFTPSTTGNATSFGTLTYAGKRNQGFSDGTYGVFGSDDGSGEDLDYVTIQTTGNSTDFGELTLRRQNAAGCSNSTRGIIAGGFGSGAQQNTIDYVTIASPSNATDFGDMTATSRYNGACSDGTYGVITADYSSLACNGIDYVTIDTTGNATDFGDPNLASRTHGVTGNSTTGIICAGYTGSNVLSDHIDSFTIATTGNASDFGDLTSAHFATAASSGNAS